jgi:four helix bundle protein
MARACKVRDGTHSTINESLQNDVSFFMSASSQGLLRKEADMKNENLFAFQRLDAYIVAKELARLVCAAKIRDRELRDQATRAAKSCFLCLSEGLPNDGLAMRQKYFVESRNSLAETVAAMDLAATIGAVRQDDADTVQALGARLRRMLTALLR